MADLAQVIWLIILITFIFATVAYFLEEDVDTFDSIFDALYWGEINRLIN